MEIIGGRYEQECPVIFGAGSIEKITDVIKDFGCSKPFSRLRCGSQGCRRRGAGDENSSGRRPVACGV